MQRADNFFICRIYRKFQIIYRKYGKEYSLSDDKGVAKGPGLDFVANDLFPTKAPKNAREIAKRDMQ